MVYAILSDVHANESTLRQVLADARKLGARRFVCLGDVVGYGPLPEETVRLVRAACPVVIAGNHDDAVSGRLPTDDFNDLAAAAVMRHREDLSDRARAWLHGLPHTYRNADFAAVHGDFVSPERFRYVRDEVTARENFDAVSDQLLFVGHTHTPGFFLTGSSGGVYRMPPEDFILEDGKRYIVNPGSVGYPRENDGTCLSSYVLYDSTSRTVRFRFLPFAVSSILPREHRRRKFPVLPAAAVAVVLVLATLAAVFWRTGPAPQPADGQDQLVLRAEHVDLTADKRKFLPNLRLEHGSAPVRLSCVFRDRQGRTLDVATITVKKSRTKAIAIPAGSASTDISLVRVNATDTPRIREYAPAFTP